MLPLRALQFFEVVSRTGSLSRASEELGVSQPAVSQQLRQLEEWLKVTLFTRTRHGVSLTDEGRALAEGLGEGFSLIRRSVERVRGRQTVTLAVLSTFAQRWLIPRLYDLQQSEPEIDLRLITVSSLEDLRGGSVDLLIETGLSERLGQAGEEVFPLFDNAAFPVAAPGLLKSKPVPHPDDLARHYWLQVEGAPRRDDWSRWLAAAGLKGLEPRGWLYFETSNQALEAAISGAGVAMGHTPFVLDALRQGILSAPLSHSIDEETACCLVCRPRALEREQVRRFKRWILGRAASESA
ncbi:LysR substrate-binding domain-containing protein [Kiloniella sp. b19]|uniref:LysR substrate-binding domain-containing protein n=1 Tax=Kiloniella sp. GXU_MW_B19 TaxID=3141326 RepID=UPI0031D01619